MKILEQDHVCVVRLATSAWHSDRGVFFKKSLSFLKRKSRGYNLIYEDCLNIGASEVIPRITNINDVDDGIYRIVTCNESKDWETGMVDDYDYMLVDMLPTESREEPR